MADLMMFFAGIFFSIVFLFLFFIFTVFLFALIKRTINYENFTPNVSIIIPAYNEEKNISQCLRSVYGQDYPKEKIEVIVVDDGSTDRTIEVVKNFGTKFFVQLHKGKSEALNLGAKNSSHEFILTIDADTILERDCLKNLVKPFIDLTVGATTGNSRVKNNQNLLGAFQSIEYSYNNMIRGSFSKLFKDGIWFFGALACYRRSVLEKVNFFKKDTLAEDMDIALDVKNAGYRTVNVSNALCSTVVPSTFKGLYKQRARWWIGTLQSLVKNKHLFFEKSPSLIFLFVNQFWWSFYSFISLPIILYQINYWLPYNMESITTLFNYLFRWFSLAGPVYVIYKIPDWGISIYSIFGVLSGIISTIMMLSAILMFKEKITLKSLFGMFFYFPYTIFLNTIILISLLKCPFMGKKYFVR